MRDPGDVRVLVPVAVLEGQVVPEQLMRILSRSTVVVLAYHEIPEQTAPEQAREQFEAKARAELDDVVEAFQTQGATVESRLVFTQDADQSIERIATEADCDAVLLSNPTPSVERVFVPVKEAINADTIARVVAALRRSPPLEITLFHAVADDDAVHEGESLLSDVTDELVGLGLDRDHVTRVVSTTPTPLKALVETAQRFDVVVMGEEEPTIRGRLFGETYERVAEQTVGPVLVVRRPLDRDETS